MESMRSVRGWIAPVCGAVAAHARRNPDSVAVRCEDGTVVTYGELSERVERVARLVAAAGAERGNLVGVLLDRGPDLVVSALAVLRAGAGYVPLDPGHPLQRTRTVVDDAHLAVVLTSARHGETLREIGVTAVDIDANTAGLMSPVPALEPSDAAYVIYTSGSTGIPKGVVNTHAALASILDWMCVDFPLSPGDRVLLRTTPTFDVSILELFWPIVQGAELAVPDPRAHQDPERLGESIRRLGVTDAYFVPSHLAGFLAEPAAAACSSLRRVFMVGEQFPAALLRRLWRLWPDTEIVNLYGPTEAAVGTLWHRCVPADEAGDRVPIGRFAGQTVGDVVDPETLQPVAAGTEGELLLGGPQLAKEYHRRPELTAEKFIDSPRGRRYRTGDIVRQLDDGAIEFLGRQDRQVKVRGSRVELDDVEAALLVEPFATAVLADVRAHPLDGNQVIVAWIAAADGTTERQVRNALAQRLPAYMIPDALILMPAFPLLANGKLDRASLPDPFEPVPPPEVKATSLRQVIQKAWEKISGASIGADEGFLESGGNSLLLLQLRGRLRALGFTQVRVIDLFEHPTPAHLAKHLEGTTQGENPTGGGPRVR
jgi:amino acid adenylation domain-containing protein